MILMIMQVRLLMSIHTVMAQFDVHKNTGKQRDSIPFVVVVQSSLFDKYRRRVVVPLCD